MSEQNVIECSSSCVVTIQHEFITPVLNLSLQEGGQIAGAVLLVWAAGFVFRVLIRMVRDTDNKSSLDE